jgi:hypothetical protein
MGFRNGFVKLLMRVSGAETYDIHWIAGREDLKCPTSFALIRKRTRMACNEL